MEMSTLLLTILTAGVCLYYFVLRKLSYFERLKIPHIRPVPLLGNMTPYIFGRVSLMDNLRNVYNLFPDAKYFGFYEFMSPVYVIRDPDLINTVTIKNFDNFCDHLQFIDEKIEPMASKNLFSLRGDRWREMRKLLSPSFTSSKMKMMFELMCECAQNSFDNYLATNSGSTGKAYDMKDVLSRYANDVIATCAFGISIDSFKHPKNEFFMFGQTVIFDTWMSLVFLMNRSFPKFSQFIKLRIFGPRVSKFFKDVVTSTVRARDEQGIVRPDMIQLMMETRDKNHGPAFDIDEMTAQAFVFFLAGFDGLSTAMAFMAHVVAVYPDIQSKLREEVDDVLKKTNGKPTYEAINNMKYLNAVINESLRLYGPGSFLDRICVKEFELPPATPDNKPVILKPGDSIWIPVFALHRDSKYYPQPEKFDPSRFLNDEVDNSVYMPFGIGPRICIANRFALMEAKIMLFYLLWYCDIEPDIKTTHPIVLHKKNFNVTPKDGFWLKVRARKSAVSEAKCLSNGH